MSFKKTWPQWSAVTRAAAKKDPHREPLMVIARGRQNLPMAVFLDAERLQPLSEGKVAELKQRAEVYAPFRWWQLNADGRTLLTLAIAFLALAMVALNIGTWTWGSPRVQSLGQEISQFALMVGLLLAFPAHQIVSQPPPRTWTHREVNQAGIDDECIRHWCQVGGRLALSVPQAILSVRVLEVNGQVYCALLHVSCGVREYYIDVWCQDGVRIV